MPILDIILLLILAGFVFYGLFYGLIRTVGSLLGVVVGAYLASRFYLVVFDWFQYLFFGHENAGKIITFIILFALINRLVGFVFAIIDRTFDLISIIPFLKTINRLAGAALGFILGGLVIGLLLYVASRYISVGLYEQYLSTSKFVPYFIKFNGLLLPLLPEILKKIKGVI